jgi:tetratricopeptide (TPR) repeat protein
MQPIERAELLEKVEGLTLNRRFVGLAELLEGQAASALKEDSELSFCLALAWSHTGKERAALELISHLLGVLEHGSRDRLLIRALNLEGALLMESGALSAARERFEEVLSFASFTHDSRFVAAATMNLATLDAMQQRWENAIAGLSRAIGVSYSAGIRHQVGGCHHNMGMVFREVRLFSKSYQHFSQARRILKIWGTKEERVATDYESALMVALAGDAQFGLNLAENALRSIQKLDHRRLEGEALRVIGIIRFLHGDYSGAQAYLERAKIVAENLGLMLLRAETAECLGIMFKEQGMDEAAEALDVEAVTLYNKIGVPSGRGQGWMKSAVALRNGNAC